MAAALGVLVGSVIPGNAQVAGFVLDGLEPGASAADPLPDPFLSAFSDRSGWWSSVRETGSPQFDFSFLDFHPLTRRLSGNGSDVHDRRFDLRHTRPLPLPTGPAWGSLTYHNQDLQTRLDASNTDLGLHAGGERFDLGLRLGIPDLGLGLQATVPVGPRGSLSARTSGLGIRFVPSPYLGIQFARTWTACSQGIRAEILEEPVPLVLNLQEDARHAAMRLSPFDRLEMETSMREASYSYQDTVSTALAYEFMPNGSSSIRSGTVKFTPRRNHQVLLKYQEGSFDLDGGSYWGGQQFGWLTYARGWQYSRLATWRWQSSKGRSFRLEYESVSLDARFRASMESWPFTSTIIDLLGVRQIWRGEVDLSWHRTTALFSTRCLGRPFQVGMSWFRAYPEASLETWRPAFLIFGSTDYRRDDLEVTRADLLSLLLETSLPLGCLDLTLSLQQFFYGNFLEPPSEPGTGEPGPDPDPDSPLPGLDDGWWGGTYLRVGGVIAFP